MEKFYSCSPGNSAFSKQNLSYPLRLSEDPLLSNCADQNAWEPVSEYKSDSCRKSIAKLIQSWYVINTMSPATPKTSGPLVFSVYSVMRLLCSPNRLTSHLILELTVNTICCSLQAVYLPLNNLCTKIFWIIGLSLSQSYLTKSAWINFMHIALRM